MKLKKAAKSNKTTPRKSGTISNGMKIVDVIPFSKTIHKESLSYFTSKDVHPGDIVSVPVRNKIVDALVVEIRNVRASKSNLRSSSFNLKKVESIKGSSPFTSEFLSACINAKDYFATYTGLVLNALIPQAFLKKYDELLLPSGEKRKKGNLKQEKLILQASFEERLNIYKTYIRSSFAKKKSVFLCIPTISDIEVFKHALEKGIEQYVHTIHGSLLSKKQIAHYNAILEESHPILIIATGSFLFIPRNDIDTIIVEKESSPAYKQIARPHIDIRSFAEIYSYNLGSKLILGDSLLRTETLWRAEMNEFGNLTPPSFRFSTLRNIEVIDMAKRKDSDIVFSKQVRDMLQRAMHNKESVFLFTLRKGFAGVTVCNDCGTSLLCSSCSIPLTLYKSSGKEGKIFVCNKCKNRETTKMLCKTCGGWNLVPLGIGEELVIDEIKKYFPHANVFSLTDKTEKEKKETVETFYKESGVLVGTEAALPYLTNKVDHASVISLDSLFSIPSFRINEKIIHLLINLTSKTKHELLVQTRNPKERVIHYFNTGNVSELYREEIHDREIFNYPPFSVIIKMTYAGNKKDIGKAKEYMNKVFGEYSPQIFDAFIARVKNRYIVHMILRLKRSGWSTSAQTPDGSIDMNLLEKLRGVPPSWTIYIDPENLL